MSQTVIPAFSSIDFDRGRLFDTTDLDEARQLTEKVFSPHSIKVVGSGQRLRCRMEHLPLGRLSLSRLTWGAAIEVAPSQHGSFYLISMPVSGQAQFHIDGRTLDVSPRRLAIVNPSQRLHFTASSDFVQIALRIERDAVEASLQALTGRTCAAPVNFDSTVPTDGASWRAIEPLLELLGRRARAPRSAAVELMDARLEELVVATLLLQQQHAASDQLLPPPRSALSVYVRRAQNYMQDHLEEPLTVSDVALACGVSVRTLQSAFKSAHGLGPLQWLREQRLHRVREALLSGDDEGQSVTAAALRFGFTHQGEFSKAYRRVFGETASRALARKP
jgi:AraC-like DNA-binding protein